MNVNLACAAYVGISSSPCTLQDLLKFFITGQVTGKRGSIYMVYFYLSYAYKSDGYDRIYDELSAVREVQPD